MSNRVQSQQTQYPLSHLLLLSRIVMGLVNGVLRILSPSGPYHYQAFRDKLHVFESGWGLARCCHLRGVGWMVWIVSEKLMPRR